MTSVASNDAVLSQAAADATASRRSRLRSAFESAGVDGLLITNEKDIRYLTAAPGHDSLLLMTRDQAILITDPRYTEFLKPWRTAAGLTVVIGTRHRLLETLQPLVADARVRRMGSQAEHLTLATCTRVAAALPDLHLIPTTGLVSGLRRRKDAYEIAAIERSIDIQHRAMESFVNEFTPSMAELEAVGLIEFHMRRLGGGGTSFSTTVQSGPSSAVIHGIPTLSPIRNNDVLLVDCGCVFDGYCSDMTRMFAVGEAPAAIAEIHDIVQEAQLAAIAACRPGVSCSDVDWAVRSIIEKSGYGQTFGHGTGHGIGLDIHEEPFLNQQNTAMLLEAGMTVTIEPGIYVPGVGGVRIEDDVLITEKGCRVLTSFPKGLRKLDGAGKIAQAAKPPQRTAS